jgi:CheY-like chemotaxis protein
VAPCVPPYPSTPMPLFVEGLSGSDPGTSRAATDRPAGGHQPAPGSAAPIGVPPFRHLAREAADALEVSRAGLWVLEEDGGLLCLSRFHRESLNQEDSRRYPPELAEDFRFFLDRVAMVAMNDTRTSRSRSGAFQDWLQNEGIRSLLALPVRARGRLAGWLTFEVEGEPRRWNDEDRKRAVAYAGHLSTVLACWGPGLDEVPLETIATAENGRTRPLTPQEPAASEAPTAAIPEAPTLPDDLSSAPEPPGPADVRILAPKPRPGVASGDARASGAPSPPGLRGGRREVRGRIRPLPGLEGAALLGGDAAGNLLHILEIQSGYLGLLDEVTAGTPRDRELVEEAREAGERVRDGLVAFLTSLREGIPGREPMDLTSFLGEISGRLSRELGNGFRLRLAPAAEILRIQGNPRLLERALLHLVRNAREASEPGTAVRVSWGRWKSPDASPSDPEMVRILVEDQGGGIPGQALPWVFEPFFSGRKGAEGERSAEAGRGLGLPVVQAVVEGHGGWVDLRSRPGEGTEVAIHLPLVFPETAEDAVQGREAASVAGALVAPRILVLEDEPLLARLLDRILTRSGFRVTVVEAPEDASHVWRRLEGDVDLVIVERVLTGGRDGLEFTEAWRQERPGLRVMVLDRRASAPEEGESAPDSLEGFPLLTRPFQPADVVGAVRRALARSGEGEGPEAGPSDPSRHPGPRGGDDDLPEPPDPPGAPGGVVLH